MEALLPQGWLRGPVHGGYYLVVVEILLKRPSAPSYRIRLLNKPHPRDYLEVAAPNAKESAIKDVAAILSEALGSSVSSPASSRIVRYMGLYLRWIASTSRFTGGLYVCGGHSLVNRRYSSSRNSIYNRYKHVFPRRFYRQVHLSEAVFVAFQHRNLSYLISFLKEMFAKVNFFKHRFLLFYLRAAFNKLGGSNPVPGVRGLFIKFRGKLAKAGNSRRQRFLLTYGQVTTNYADSYVVEKFQIKTFTGAIGCTIIMCCN